MILESIKTNIDVSEVLVSVFIAEAVDYMARVVRLNDASQDRITEFFLQLENEFRLMCSIRKFTILNTNVVRENQKRILENDTLRSFYFEMFKSVLYRLDLGYSEKDSQAMLWGLVGTASRMPCSATGTMGKQNQLIVYDQDFKNLCGSVYVDGTTIKDFLGVSPWYHMAIIANICAPALLENIKALSSVK